VGAVIGGGIFPSGEMNCSIFPVTGLYLRMMTIRLRGTTEVLVLVEVELVVVDVGDAFAAAA
jgi:hypothetical protein